MSQSLQSLSSIIFLGQKPSGAEKESEKAIVDASHQAVAVLGIALIGMGEEVGSQMAMRSFAHLVSRGKA